MLPVLPCVHSCHLGLQNTIRNLESVYLYQPDLFILHVDFAAWSMRVSYLVHLTNFLWRTTLTPGMFSRTLQRQYSFTRKLSSHKKQSSSLGNQKIPYVFVEITIISSQLVCHNCQNNFNLD